MLRLVLCVGVLLAGFGTLRAAEEPLRVFFGPRAADDGQGLFLNLMKFLDSAQTTLYGSVHEVDMIVVAEKLAAKAAAGVEVVLTVEADWLNIGKNTAARKILQASKVQLIPDTKKSGLMHNKFFIADKVRIWTGSTNLTETCLFFNPNNGLWLESPQVAANYLAEFEAQRQGLFGKKAKSGKVIKPFPSVQVGDAVVQTYFSPQDDPLKPIVAAVEQAKTSIDVMAFVFSSKDVGQAILAAKNRGVKVRVLLDNAFSSEAMTRRWPFVPAKEFRAAGVFVKYDDEDSKLHHKVILIDSRLVITGSLNFSVSAAVDNDENMLIIESANVAKKYQVEFERLWAYFNGDPGKPPPPERGDDGGN